MDFHFATVWEAVADAVGDRPAVYCAEVVQRAPNGKADYRWAKEAALAGG